MTRLKCGKCGNVFEYEYKPMDSFVHLGPYKRIRCPACGKNSFFNVYSSVKEPTTDPLEEKKPEEKREQPPTEEEQEQKRIEESKYEET